MTRRLLLVFFSVLLFLPALEDAQTSETVWIFAADMVNLFQNRWAPRRVVREK